MTDTSFSWIPIYRELSKKLMAYERRQDKLIAFLEKLRAEGLPITPLKDRTKSGSRPLLKEIDPFTFFGVLNRRITDKNRRAILDKCRAKFGLAEKLPDDFNGIPVLDNRNSWFFSYAEDRSPKDVPALWRIAAGCVSSGPDSLDPDTYAKAAGVAGYGKLTMGLFWLNPNQYLALDSVIGKWMSQLGIPTNREGGATLEGYQRILKTVRQQRSEPFYVLSREAWMAKTQPSRYWLFQANPSMYDLAGALRAGALKSWQVNQHKKEIHPGDRVIIWQSGAASGWYGVATVMTEVAQITGSVEEQSFWKGDDASESVEGVEIRVDRAFPDEPILKANVLTSPALTKVPIGRRGTNFELTPEQFAAFEALAPAGGGQEKYWLYAPGPGADRWDEFFTGGIMALGWEKIADLTKYPDREAVRRELKRQSDKATDPHHDSLALWEFANVVKPGDVVIAKKGRTAYLGYGIVAGDYRHEPAREAYPHVRSVKWIKKGEWSSGDFKIVTKTLTDITKYPKYVAELKRLIGIDTNEDLPIPVANLPARNIILYGPPGTGKTYAVRTKYFELFTDRMAAETPDERATRIVRDRAWWEVIALTLLDQAGKSAKVSEILVHPLVGARIRLASNRNPRAMLWAALQNHTKSECLHVKYAVRTEPLLFSKDEQSVWSIDAELAKQEVPELLAALEDFKKAPATGAEIKRYRFTTFHQSFSYEDFIEGIKPQMEDRDNSQVAYEIRPGVFKEIIAAAHGNPGKNYALFIDEINRGNIASIFGELITLIEEDKRLGADNEIKAVLPYSRESFGVPKNLYIIGTMNTADRSVEALDTALRRRFTFIEMRPDAGLVASSQPANLKVDLAKLMETINARIERLLDHDHAIGHSFFLKVKDLPSLQRVFKNEILPLLREFFFGNPAKIGLILGERFVTKKTGVVAFKGGDWGAEDLDEKDVFAFADPEKLTEEDFVSIYA